MSVRAKFICDTITPCGDGNQIRLNVVYSEDVQSEDGRFTKYTPFGTLQMQVDNPNAAIQFEVGKKYYVDFMPAEN